MEGNKLQCIHYYNRILTLYPIAFSTALAQLRVFDRVPSPSAGPVRLSAGWTDRSLMSCVTSRMTRYNTGCQSILYNNIINFCTPGQWLNQSQPIPTAEEGDLYATSPCDCGWGFELHTYNTTRVCLFNGTTTALNYTDATALCKSLNSNLYTVKTPDKLALLQGLLEQPKLWVGLDDRQEEGKFVWQDDGTEIDPDLIPLVFAPNQPSQDDNTDCVLMSKNVKDLLNDRKCRQRIGFFCEKETYY